MYKIEKNIVLPEVTRGAPRKYPFNKMEVGDSFSSDAECINKIRGAVYAYASRHGKKFSVMLCSDICRVWRVS